MPKPGAFSSTGTSGVKLTPTMCRLAKAKTRTTRHKGTSTSQPTMRLRMDLKFLLRRPVSRLCAVQPLADFLAGLELGDVFFPHVHLLAGARIAPHAGRAVLDRECAKTPQFHPVAAGQRVADLVEDGIDDVFDV